MSRVSTRSYMNNENENPTGVKDNNASKNKRYNTRRSSRQALGDISNRVKAHQEDRKSKKKRVVGTTQHSNKQHIIRDNSRKERRLSTSSTHSENVQMIDDLSTSNKSSFDAKMETTLENGVADLHLSSIDADDKDNPQMVSDYVNDIMAYFRRTEGRRAPSPTYMSKHTDINAKMREILIDWLVEVHLKFKLVPETLFLTVNVIDRFLERRAVSRNKLQLVGCTAMLIASKYEEIFAPELRDFVYISDKAYTREQILSMESIMLNTLEFNLTVPSALRFADRFIKVGSSLPGWSRETEHLTRFLVEHTLQDYKFLRFLPSTIAASAVYLAQLMTGISSPWNSLLQSHTQYTEQTLQPCIMALYNMLTRSNPKYRAVRKKYSHRNYLEVAKLSPVEPFTNGSR